MPNRFDTPSQAYMWYLRQTWVYHDHRIRPRDLPCRECQDVLFHVVHPSSSPIETSSESRNEIIEDYTWKEHDLYLSCNNRVETWAKASKFWHGLANPDGTVNSAYGRLIWYQQSCGNLEFEEHPLRTPWVWARESLIRDRDSRQAYVRFSLPEHQWFGNKDQVCTMHMQFMIRGDALNATVVMRSQDIVKGLVYDMPFFMYLMERMVDELRLNYSDLRLGTYGHMVHSLHAYEKDEKVIRQMLEGDQA